MSPAQPAARPDRPSRPGWPEIATGLVVLAIVGVGVASQLGRLGLDAWSTDLILTALSGVGEIAGFAAADALRIGASADQRSDDHQHESECTGR